MNESPSIRKFNVAKNMIWLLMPPILLTAGLTIFTQSFFLSRTSFNHRSSCNVGSAGNLLQSALGLNNDEIQFLRKYGYLSDGEDIDNISSSYNAGYYGCWVPRRVDSMAILVVDALRFDFARDHLPLSIGSRLFPELHHQQNNHNDNTTSALRNNNDNNLGTSKLYQFVADPPTVTMQRLKGLTTGGLPTFADISGSFGGASIDEDSWVEQLKDVPWDRRRIKKSSVTLDITTKKNSNRSKKPQIAFVGDDTWVDLFPTQFDDCHPFPSFNTRDLDTVDNGCLEHLPRLLDGLVGLNNNNNMNKQQSSSSPLFELIVSHFLGVDHVGHTYGPNNPHMESKLHQMDVMLSNTLNIIDNAPRESCIVALVLGDHGMTEDGNHGGGTSDEVNAGLFVHFSPGCNNNDDKHDDGKVTGEDIPGSAHVFDSIHQIDLVPTISFLLGLPIPYANIGGLVLDLLPTPSDVSNNTQSATASTTAIQHMAVALALNAAQVWNYLDTYSQTSRDLPLDRLKELKELLDSATLVYRDAIVHSQRHINNKGIDKQQYFDATAYRQACGLYKLFLAESTGLGKQVWTQFNEGGMNIGIGILVIAWIMAMPLWKVHTRREIWAILFRTSRRNVKDAVSESNENSVKENYLITSKNSTMVHPSFRRLELLTAILFMVFQCGVLTFSNSYIEHEREIVTFFLCVICLLVFRRWCYSGLDTQTTPNVGGHGALVYLPLVVALCSRINDVFVTGHGLDPSIRLHAAHHPIVFLSSLFLLAILRLSWLRPTTKHDGKSNKSSVFTDLIALVCLAGAWLEKRSLDHSRNGFTMTRLSMVAISVGLGHSASCLMKRTDSVRRCKIEHIQLALFRSMLFVVVVTGPSAASTALLASIQCASLRLMMQSTGTREVPAPVMAAIWRLAIRLVFFGTNHHCSFNRLQFSAAFVATETFQFFIAGSSLFMNTFGWEILGSMFVLANTRASISANKAFRDGIWDWFRFFQLTEMLASCISVSAMKRHLMVWAIFAPRFMFAAVFTAVSVIFWVIDVFLSIATRNHSKQSSS